MKTNFPESLRRLIREVVQVMYLFIYFLTSLMSSHCSSDQWEEIEELCRGRRNTAIVKLLDSRG